LVAYSFKSRFVAPICVGLNIEIPVRVGLKIACGTEIRPKRHTIRAIGKRRHAMAGEELQLYHAQRSRDCFLIARANCTDTKPIYIDVREDADMRFRIGKKWLSDREAEAFALSDGFGSIEDMWLFWRREHKGVDRFAGVLVEWAP